MSIEAFAGTRRYTPTRVLGAGSWGRVYQAYDNERNAFVAVKLLQRASPDALMRFKREFRSLQDLVHPNLVTLYELLSDEGRWFFTMELVDGQGFLDHVRATPSGIGYSSSSSGTGAPTINERAGGISLNASTATVEKPAVSAEPLPPPKPRPQVPRHRAAPEALGRLRTALGQLVEGICGLHAAGKLHRDIKPSNVLVSKEGRVVLLDFGLVHELSEPFEQLNKGMVVGTPAYMSPEQAGGLPLGEASDWYAVGVLIYEALAGHVPFEGPSAQMLKQRRTEDPPAPSQLADGVPPDLDALCMRLLSRRPEQRPSGTELRARFAPNAAPAAARPPERRLVGRESELGALRAAYAWVKERRAPALVSIEAPSGLGKTALLAQFLSELDGLVLESRCGEHEAVPFKAFDGAVDALAAQVLPREVLPRDLRSLVRVFPVLKRAETGLGDGFHDVPADPTEVRRRAFAALRELVLALGRRAPLVLVLDDLHFSDEDSAAMLEALLRSPALPPVLLVASFRPDPNPAPAVRALEEAAFAAAGAHDVQLTRLVLAPLADVAARAYLEAQLGGGAEGERAALIENLLREGRGSPLLLGQLASIAGSGASTLAEWVQQRMATLAPPARRLLEVVAVADRPVERMVAWHAAGLDKEQSDPLMTLKSARLLSSEGERLVPYQRDVGDAIRASVPQAERERLLLALADALAASATGDFECVADWTQAAGQVLRASLAAERAGDQARDVLAFDRAARLYERALKARTPEDLARLQRARAESLAAAGRGKESAAAYLTLASTAERSEALALRQRAAEQLLYSGHVDAGLAVMSEVMAALGEPMPKSDALARAWTTIARVRVELHGLKWSVKPVAEQSQDALARTDAYWAAAKGFSLVDPVRGTGFQFTHFRHALDCGDPYRIARALALEAGFHALIGSSHERACMKSLQLLHEVLKHHPNDHAEGLAAMMAGCAALARGDLRESASHLGYAVSIFQEKCPGMTWEITSALQYLAYTLRCLGEYDRARGLLDEVREWAQARGDVYALTNFRVRVGAIVRLMDDDPRGARHEVTTGLAAFSRAGYFAQHMWGYFADVEALLYDGRVAEAVAREKTEWPLLRTSGMMRIQLSRVLMAYLKGQLAALDPLARPTAVEEMARLLDSEKIEWAAGLASLLRGAASARDGRTAVALEQIDVGARKLDAVGACTHAVAARRAAGELRGAVTERDEADAWFRERGVKRPERFAGAFFTLPR